MVSELNIRAQASIRWTPENQIKSLKVEHPDLFYPRSLGTVVIKSVTNDFYTTLQNYADIELSDDGLLLLWLILTHLHTSTITYKEKLRAGIRSRSLASDHNHDVQTYLIWLRHQFDTLHSASMATNDSDADLIEPIFIQLLTTKSCQLRREVEDWHLEYHTEKRTLTPLKLIDLTNATCKALRCTNQLTHNGDPKIMALQAKLDQQQQLTTQVFNAIATTLGNKNKPGGKQNGQGCRHNGKQPGHERHPT
jgi:hypothetical protein